MKNFWLIVITELQSALILLGVVLFLITPREGKLPFFELGLILIASALTELTSVIGHFVFHVNTNLVLNIFNIINLPLALFLYRRKIHWRSRDAIGIIWLIVFVIFGVTNLLMLQKPHGVNSFTTTFASISFVVLSLTYFYFLIQQLPTQSITTLPMFWVNTAILIYYSGAFVLYLTADYLINVLGDNLVNAWTIHNFLGIMFYSLLSIGLWLNRTAVLQGKVTNNTPLNG